MKHKSCVAMSVTIPLAGFGVWLGSAELALFVLAGLGLAVAAGVILFVGMVAFGWLGPCVALVSRRLFAPGTLPKGPAV